MSKIFCLFSVLALIFALAQNRADAAAAALLEAGEAAIGLAVRLTGAMALWCGLTEILRQAGDMARLSRVLRRVMAPLFPGLRDDAAWEAMSANMAANMLGLGNAATPAGIEAARRLSSLGETGLRALAMFLALNSASLQWMPTTVISLRAAAGSADPAGIWLPTLAVSGVSAFTAAGLMLFVQRGGRHG